MRYTRDTSTTSTAPLTEAEKRALILAAVSQGKDAVRAIAGLLAVVVAIALVAALAVGVTHAQEGNARAVSAATEAPYGSSAP